MQSKSSLSSLSLKEGKIAPKLCQHPWGQVRQVQNCLSLRYSVTEQSLNLAAQLQEVADLPLRGRLHLVDLTSYVGGAWALELCEASCVTRQLART